MGQPCHSGSPPLYWSSIKAIIEPESIHDPVATTLNDEIDAVGTNAITEGEHGLTAIDACWKVGNIGGGAEIVAGNEQGVTTGVSGHPP
jgi:hypothetical protein